jgi:hypothetical protein
MGIAVSAQELFTYTEPASNMPAHSIGIRLTNQLLDEQHLAQQTYQALPELMWGVNKNLMLHLEAFANNSGQKFALQGAGIYAKYRFLSADKMHRHFRMAAFARLAYNQGHLHYAEIETNGMNTGGELGFVATQLLHKQALSASASYERIGNNGANNIVHTGNALNALNYTISTGRLVAPRQYRSYRQTNLNLMLEFLGQVQPNTSVHYLDIAPSIQLIIHSQTRVDIGFRRQLVGNMDRMATNSALLRLEHLLFGVL